MDIVNVAKFQSRVAVVSQIFEAAALELVALSGEFRPCVENDAAVPVLAFLATSADLVE